MKRLSLAIVFACITLTLAAQDIIKVNFKGSAPTISDFAWAFLSAYEYDEEEDVLNEARSSMKNVWIMYHNGESLPKGETLTIDKKNGYVLNEYRQDGGYLTRIEMCYWNESDGRHKLFAYNVRCFKDGKCEPGQFDGFTFYRYDNTTRKMTYCDPPGFTQVYGTDDGARVSYALPRTGKDITYTAWYENGTKKQKTLKWNGRRFRM